MNATLQDARTRIGVLVAVLLAELVVRWIRPLPRCFWLDEVLTDWMARSPSLAVLFDRVQEFQAGSVYHLVPWTLMSVFPGASEAALRAPSLIAALLALFAVGWIGERLVDRETGLMAAVVFAANPVVGQAAVDARPYALGLLCVTLGMALYLRWLERASWPDGIGFVLLAALAVHIHLLLALVAVGQVLAALPRARERIVQTLVLGTLGVGLCLPAVGTLMLVAGRSTLYSFSQGGPVDLLRMVVPGVVLGGAAVGLLLARPLAEGAWELRHRAWPARTELVAVALWFLLTPLVVLALWTLGSTNLIVPRYLIASSPAGALIFALLASRLAEPRTRVLVGAGVAGFAAVVLPAPLTGPYREQQAVVAAEQPDVVFVSNLVEANDPTWLEDPERWPYLLAFANRYPLDAPLVPIPAAPGPPQLTWMDATLVPGLEDVESFVIVGTRPEDFASWASSLPGFSVSVGDHCVVARRTAIGAP